MVAPGKLSVEVRHLVRDPIDLTAAMLTNCGAPAQVFPQPHRLPAQPEPLDGSGQQRQPGAAGALDHRHGTRTCAPSPAISASTRSWQSRGYDRMAVDRCLADEAMAAKLAAQTSEAASLGVNGTPSFLLNGELLAGTHDWQASKPQLDARM